MKTIRALAIAALIGGAALISAGDASAWSGMDWNNSDSNSSWTSGWSSSASGE